MKLLKTASGKTTVKMSRSEWEDMGKKAGWMKEAQLTQEKWTETFEGEKDTPDVEGLMDAIANGPSLGIDATILQGKLLNRLEDAEARALTKQKLQERLFSHLDIFNVSESLKNMYRRIISEYLAV